jgi:hypothetical protein
VPNLARLPKTVFLGTARIEHDRSAIWLQFIAHAVCGKMNNSELVKGLGFEGGFRSDRSFKNCPVAESGSGFADFLVAELQWPYIRPANVGKATAFRKCCCISAYLVKRNPQE